MSSLETLVTALDEMSTAWAWSRRALVAIRQLAEEWSVCEDIQGALSVGIPSPNSKLQDDDSTSEGLQMPPILDSGMPPWLFEDLDGVDEALSLGLWQELDCQPWVGLNSN